MEITRLFEEEKEFFLSYKDRFKENLIKNLNKFGIEGPQREEIEKSILFLYEALLHLDSKKFVDRLKDVLYKLHKLNVPLRQTLVCTFADLIKDFIEYLQKQQKVSITKIKTLTDAVHKFLSISDEMFAKYIEETASLEEKEEEIPDRREQEKIMKLLKQTNPVTMTILGLYKDFPVYCKTDVFKIGDSFLKVSICPYKIFTPGTKVFIKVSQIPKGILANIVNVDGGYYVLSPLKLTEFPQIKSVRVFPEKEIDVQIDTGEKKLYGFLAYISVGELGVILRELDGLEKGKKVKVKFRLPTGEVETSATVREIKELQGSYKVELLLDLDLRLDQIISRYVLERQRQILKEIKL